MSFLKFLFGMFFMVIGIASVWLLFKIGGKSDGPGALFVYIGAIGGLGLGWSLLKS
jgi:hypothetical protein